MDYDYRPVGTGQEELQTIAGLFATVWPEAQHLKLAYLQWLYVDNPNGPVIGINAWAGDELAGHYVVVPILAGVEGQEVPAALSLNTAVHPGHQGKGLFTKLARQTYELAAQRGARHIIGVANANSTPGFLRKLEFQLLGPLETRLLWRWPRREPRSTPAGWQRLWQLDDLRWRLANPSASYSWCHRGGQTQILAPTGKHGIQALLKTGVTDGAGDDLTQRGGGLAPVLWMGCSSSLRFPALGSCAVPRRFRASPLNLILRPLDGNKLDLPPNQVEFEAIDFDAY